ncbi:MAG: cysteine desulfurase [Actinobacteria bacterium]|nr:cysteine desulfurase [Actinomycetota bacterium]MCL5445323.1 cysteine desulfurase [Actinomycetota bacterium]
MIIYMDYASTSPLRPEVVEAMAPFNGDNFGNASGGHRVSRYAKKALEDARDSIAESCGVESGEVFFTSGGTESDNIAVLGTLGAENKRRGEPTAVVCSAVEHPAVFETFRSVGAGRGLSVGSVAPQTRLAAVDGSGVVDLGSLEEVLDQGVVLVSVMLANNETGTIQPLSSIVDLVRRLAPDAVFHTDAVQGACYLDLASALSDVDVASISAHKLGGPKGVGAVVVRKGINLAPLFHGGGQERGLRSGTSNVAGAVGLASALSISQSVRESESTRVGLLRDRLVDEIKSSVPGVTESSDRSKVLPGHAHIRFQSVDREELVVLLDQAGVCVSAGSACSSGALEPSRVLSAMGVDKEDARGAIRFSLGHMTTAEDVERALAVIPEAVGRLRA